MRIARVNGARVVVVALLVRVDTAKANVTAVDGAWVSIVAVTIHRGALTSHNVAIIGCARVMVVTNSWGVLALTGCGIAGVYGAF